MQEAFEVVHGLDLAPLPLGHCLGHCLGVYHEQYSKMKGIIDPWQFIA